MHIGRFQKGDNIFYGSVCSNEVDKISGDVFLHFSQINEKFNLTDLKVLTPTKPTKIILVGLNYTDHARELHFDIPKEPVLFLKPPTSILAHNESIILPEQSNRVDYEAELAFIIKKQAYKVNKEKAHEYILGYTCLNDVTARDLQKKDGQWMRAKSFNTFCPFGPFIFIPDKEFNPHQLNITARVNSEIKQNSNTDNLIFNVYTLLEFISNVMTLHPGDVISTGTPSGIGPLQKGDVVEVEIEKVGKLINTVK